METKPVANKYAISSDIKKVKEHIGSGISKITLDGEKIKGVDVFAINAGQKLAIEGFAGFSTAIKEFGYYFDGNEENAIVSKAKTADNTAKQKAGDKAKMFNIEADTTGLSGGEHTLTYFVKFNNGKSCELITYNLNVGGANSGFADGSESSSESGYAEDDGCNSVISVGIVLPVTVISCVAITKKKKED